MAAVSGMLRVGLVVAPLALLLVSVAAHAEAPVNDDIGGASQVGALPYADSVNIAEASDAAGDLDCSGLLDEHTVWYRFDAASDTVLGIRLTSSVSELSLAIGSGSPGSLSLEYCRISTTHLFTAAGGTTYYLQIASCCGAVPGPVSLSVEEVQPLSAHLEIDGLGAVDAATGVARVSGTIACNRATPAGTEVVVQGTLTQRHGRSTAEGWLVPAHLTSGCSTTSTPWEATTQVLSDTGFSRGKALLNATGFACDEFQSCAAPDSVAGTVRLR